MKRLVLRFFSPLATLAAGTALGVPMQNNQTQSNSPYPISSSDFLQSSGASVSGTGNLALEGIQGLAALNDGLYGPQSGANANPPGLGAFSAGAGDTVNITFPQPNGVTLNSLVSTAAWDGARASQAFQFEYESTLLPGVWHRAATVSHDPGQLPGNTNTQSIISDSSGTLGTNISKIRFNYGNTSFWGWNGYREIDATGSASAAPSGPQVINAIQINELFTPSSSDLLQSGGITTTTSGNFNDEGSLGITALTDGSFGPSGGGTTAKVLRQVEMQENSSRST